jgi:type II secretory pathway component PulF
MAEQNGQSNGDGGGGRLSADEAVQLTGQIADLTRAELPLPSGLRALGEEVSSRRLRRTLDGLAGSLEAGASLEEAIASQGKRLPAHLRSLVEAGTRTGRVGEVFGRFAGYREIGIQLRRSFWLMVARPLLATVLAFAIGVFACVWVMGQFKAIFKDFGLAVPLLTRLMFAISDVLEVTWRPVLEVTVGLLVLWCLVNWFISAPLGRSLAARVPLIGPLGRFTTLAEFSHLLGLLLEAELPLPEALPMAAEGVQDAELMAACRGVSREVASGESLATALGSRSVFPRGLGQVLSWAERHRSLPEAMHMVGEMFEARAQSQATFAATVLVVLLIIIILGGFGLVIPAVMVPMINLIQKLSG